jgi:hypothetical protein
MRQRIGIALVALALGGGCKDAAMEQENAKLKAQVAEQEANLAKAKAELGRVQAENTQMAQKAAAPAPAATAAASGGLAEAQDAYIHGNYEQAIELARAHTADDPGRAWRIIGTSNCFLKNKKGVDEALKNAPDDKARQLMQYVCGRNGIKL